MQNSVLTKIHWLPPEEGGRNSLPAAKRYSTVSRFTEDADSWLSDAWSIVLEFDKPPSEQGNPSIGRASFLAEEAPVGRLQPGREFGLYEGRKKVAIAKVLEEQFGDSE